MPIALYNGGIVMEYGTENVLYSNFIDCFAVANILNNLPLNRTNAYIYTFYVDNDSMKENYEDLIIEKVYGIGKKNETYDVNGTIIEWIDSEKIIDLQVNAILVKKRGLDDNQIEKLLSYLKSINKISFTDSGNGFIEIKSKGSSKAIIYKFINEDKKCKFKKILAIGDNDNDKELFQSSDISVAVANSSSLAIDEADYVCKNENANGFLDMLNVLKTAKKYWIDKGE
jgi:hydroxymethylpyrimidine pyrophosphatase-like HAD family hydrolase